MIDARGNNLVFLLCVPRSGSSLATVMLQNHTEVFATQEIWFLMKLRDLQANVQRPYGGTAILNQFFNGVVPEELFEMACRSFARDIYNGLLRSSAARLVVDKSPRYYYMLEFLDRLFPEARRIWLTRNPLSVAASYKRVAAEAKERFDLAADLRQPAFNAKIADLTAGLFRYADYFAEPGPYAYRLSYERLATEPREQLRLLCGYLGIPYEEGLERYGERASTPKSKLFYSMGVGDPFLSRHREPHAESIGHWRTVLTPAEIDSYCRAVGADLFRRLGYGEELAEAERLTGVRYDPEPDLELLRLRMSQPQEASGYAWTPGYRMRTDSSHIAGGAGEEGAAPDAGGSPDDALLREKDAEILRLRITQRALEKRLEHNLEEKRRLRAKVDSLDGKINRLKSAIPFGHRLSRLASRYLTAGGDGT